MGGQHTEPHPVLTARSPPARAGAAPWYSFLFLGGAAVRYRSGLWLPKFVTWRPCKLVSTPLLVQSARFFDRQARTRPRGSEHEPQRPPAASPTMLVSLRR